MKIKEDSLFKKRIARRDGLCCRKCNERDIEKLSVDHIIPISMGGSIGIKNLQFLCLKCHTIKDRYVGQTGFGGRKKFKQKVNNRNKHEKTRT